MPASHSLSLRRLPIADTVPPARSHSARSSAATAHEPLEQTPLPPSSAATPPYGTPSSPCKPLATPPRCRPSRTYTRKPDPSSSHPLYTLSLSSAHTLRPLDQRRRGD
ncbi:hypothetical protein CCMA1212_008076 [Trichoderma ghanense]|uniref:Uncharacterized protein n=1 Tax=Trichoderma ghanense TaxID=65468 RepID=A0ABY2GVY3_9HYPO